MFIKCYTLTNSSYSAGIEVDQYESIVADPDTKLVTTACIHLIPVLKTLIDKDPDDFAKVASGSLAFICAENSDENISDEGILISLNPNDWALTFDKAHVVLVDPAGVGDRILVYVQAGTKYHIQHRRDNKTLFVDNNCNIAIHTTNRASLFMQALSLPIFKTTLPGNKHRCSPASSKKKPGNRRNSQQETQ